MFTDSVNKSKIASIKRSFKIISATCSRLCEQTVKGVLITQKETKTFGYLGLAIKVAQISHINRKF